MELALKADAISIDKNRINIMEMFKKRKSDKREKMLRDEVKRIWNGTLHKCCGISANNHEIAYVVCRSVFGYPRVEQIARPGDVKLAESYDCVIIKDGYVYELTRRVE